MMKKFMALCLFCALSFTTYAQEYLKICVATAPKEMAGSQMDGLLEGTVTLKSGKELKWALMYDKKANKPMIMNFTCPADVNKEEFDETIQGMTIREFWTSIGDCIIANPNANQAIDCITVLQQTALSDCIAFGTKTYCWMLNN